MYLKDSAEVLTLLSMKLEDMINWHKFALFKQTNSSFFYFSYIFA